jgi:hypothetical protein
MEWHDACIGSSLVTARYETVPPLDPFLVYDCQLEPGLPSFNVCGYLPRLPDNPDLDLADGQIADRADIYLSFMDLTDLQLSGVPDQHGGKLRITKHNQTETRFKYESYTFQFAGTCNRAAIGGFGVLSKTDPNHREPRGPQLFSHHNVWNSCLLLLQEYGYALRASGHSAHRDYPSRLRWHATTESGTDLSANSPIELLGLASLHRYHTQAVDEPNWWRIDGPSLLSDLIAEWERQSDPTKTGDANAK